MGTIKTKFHNFSERHPRNKQTFFHNTLYTLVAELHYKVTVGMKGQFSFAADNYNFDKKFLMVSLNQR